MKVTVVLTNGVTEEQINVEAVGSEDHYYWIRERENGKRTVAKYPWDKIIAIEEFYDD